MAVGLKEMVGRGEIDGSEVGEKVGGLLGEKLGA